MVIAERCLDWPATLDEANAVPIVPRCPESCCFRQLCCPVTQARMRARWDDGTVVTREDCESYQRLATLHRETTGCEPPATSADLVAALRTIRSRP